MKPTKSDTASRQHGYWLGLSAMYSLALSVVVMTDGVWPWAMGAAFIVFVVVQGLYYRQIGREVQGKFATANPSVGIIAGIFGLGALLLHGSDAAFWAGPLLGLASFAALYVYLLRFGRFYRPEDEAPR